MWVGHLQDNGFQVKMVDANEAELAAIAARYGVPKQLASCHTAVVDGYVVEGHVPAADVKRLLSERPAVVGLAVPGMPIGSPGMDDPRRPSEPYEVLTFDKEGNTQVYARH